MMVSKGTEEEDDSCGGDEDDHVDSGDIGAGGLFVL